MNRQFSAIIIVFLMVVLFVTLTSAQDLPGVPTVINYQGFLTDADGQALTDSYDIIFRLYPDTSKTSNWEWSEEQTVEVTNGLFNVLLGSVTPLTPDDLQGDKYLGITISGELEMEPRIRIASVAYSLRAGQANNAFWRSTWFTALNIATTHKTAEVRYNANDATDWVFISPHLFAERNLIVTGCQLVQDNDTNGDTYYIQLTKNGAEVGSELSIIVAKNHELYFENFSAGHSFNRGDKIGVRLRSAEGGGEEVACFLSGYCID